MIKPFRFEPSVAEYFDGELLCDECNEKDMDYACRAVDALNAAYNRKK